MSSSETSATTPAAPLPTTKPTLDERLINWLGRTLTCLIIGSISSVIIELAIRIYPYLSFSSLDRFLDEMDSLRIFLYPYFPSFAINGLLTGIMVSLTVALSTNKIERRLIRSGVGVVVGITMKFISQTIVRLYKDGNLRDAIDIVRLTSSDLLIAGLILGLFLGLMPLAKR